MEDCLLARDVELRDRTTFRVGACASLWADARTARGVVEGLAHARALGTRVYVLGEGSNVLFADDFDGMVLHPRILGVERLGSDSGTVRFRVGSGESLDRLCEMTSEEGLWGLERLAGIPGSVGAAPVQNVGAYGAEIGQVLEAVEVVDRSLLTPCTLGVEELALGYRSSIFKGSARDRYVITHAHLRLQRARPSDWTGERLGWDASQCDIATPRDVYSRVVEIRTGKLPRVGEVGSAGSFFKNPLVPRTVFESLRALYPDIPHYPGPPERVKLSAGWLIDRCGWKGYRDGDVGVWPHQALVLVNYGGATGADVLALSDSIRADVLKRMGVSLEAEVNIVRG